MRMSMAYSVNWWAEYVRRWLGRDWVSSTHTPETNKNKPATIKCMEYSKRMDNVSGWGEAVNAGMRWAGLGGGFVGATVARIKRPGLFPSG